MHTAAALQLAHDLHAARLLGTGTLLVFCVRCGSYAETNAVNLRRACKGHFSEQGRRRLKSIRKGRHPVTGSFLARPFSLLDRLAEVTRLAATRPNGTHGGLSAGRGPGGGPCGHGEAEAPHPHREAEVDAEVGDLAVAKRAAEVRRGFDDPEGEPFEEPSDDEHLDAGSSFGLT